MVPSEDHVVWPMYSDTLKAMNQGKIESLAVEPPPYLTRRDGWLGASKLGGCARELSYMLSGVTPDSTPSDPESIDSGDYATWAAGVGTLVHTACYVSAADHGYEHEVSFELGEPWRIESDADLVSWDRSEVGDIKTMSASKFSWAVRNSSPYYKHVIQVGVGMKSLGLDHGRVAYLCRDRAPGAAWRAEFTFTADEIEPWLDQALRTIQRVRELGGDGELAPRWAPMEMPVGARIVSVPTLPGGYAHWELEKEDGECELGRNKICTFCDFKQSCGEQLDNERK